ncbi:MAG TPA: T9SS type A sorting domain-containing protein [Bacteroidetes bacterium]|nr:T9SS type A sorting domain-containing protein [Bacteroidota bacterium]
MTVFPLISYTQVTCPDDSENPYEYNLSCTTNSCSGKLVFNVAHTIVENDDGCGEYIVNYDLNISSGQNCIKQIDRVRVYSGNKYKTYVLGQDMSFLPEAGGEIALDFYLETVCDEIFHVHHSCFVPVSPNVCEGCGNTYNYCDFYDPQIYWRTVCEEVEDPETGEITIECHDEYYNTTPLLQFVIFDYPDGTWEVLNSGNTYGVFHFPYYMYSSDMCSYPQGLYDFVQDMNQFLDLAQTGLPEYQFFYGHCSLLEFNDSGMCKTYIQYENMGVFIEHMGGTNYAREGCEFIVDDDGNYITNAFIHGHDLDFHCSSECILAPVEGIPPENLCWHSGIPDPGMINSNMELSYDFDCYPTVVDDEIFVEITGNVQNKYDASILNLNGQMVIPVSIHDSFTKVDVSKLENGFYLLKLVNLSKGNFKIKKFIKQ